MTFNSQWKALYKTRSRSTPTGRAWYEDKTLCPCCFYPTFNDHESNGKCRICGWTDIGQWDADAGEVKGGPNADYSLREARANFRKFLDRYRASDVELKRAVHPSLKERKAEIEEFNRQLTGTKPENFCCERFHDCYKEREILFAYADTQEIDETQWYVEGFFHLYYCPFCGASIKGRGFGNDR